MTLKIRVAQFDFVVGDMAGNARRIIDAARASHADGARLLLTPELSICGYAAEDLFLRPAFIAACDDAVKTVARELAGLKGMVVVVGHPSGGDERTRSRAVQHRSNAASVLCEGRVLARYAKRELPNYQVFDERRYFTPGRDVCVFPVGESADRRKVGLLICEDAWFDEPARLAKAAGAELLAVINASPFHVGKAAEREEAMRQRAQAGALPRVYAHLVGGQDEVVFEGRSFALQADGRLAGLAPAFKEDLFEVQVESSQFAINLVADTAPATSPESELWDALVLGVRDYIGKNGFPGAIIGLSGGIDSALTLCVAVDALGPERVRAVMMPSPYTAQMSLDDSRALVANLGVRYDEIPIEPAMNTFADLLARQFEGLPADTTEENLQSRIRGMILMALSNKTGAIVLTTGNKSEMATGYATLYGDMAGGFAVLKDLYKTFVFRLARWRNTVSPVIPENIITRPPSAELKPDQKDQDSLPPYEVLDAIIEAYMERDESPREIIARGYPEAEVRRAVAMLKRNEYKRRQSPVGIRVTKRGFGKDWRYPITSRYLDEY